MSGALLDERVVAVQPSLVRAVGGSVTRAAVVQQIHWHALAGHVHAHAGHDWVVSTYAELGLELGLSAEQVRRAVTWLELRVEEVPGQHPGREPLLETVQPEGYCRRKWYRVLPEHPALSDSSNRRDRRLQSARSTPRSGGSAVTPSTDSEEVKTRMQQQDEAMSRQRQAFELASERNEERASEIAATVAAPMPSHVRDQLTRKAS